MADLTLVLLADWSCQLRDLGGGCIHGFANTAREGHGIGTRCDHFQAFAIDCFAQDRGRGRTIASDIIGLAGCLFDQLRPEVFKRIIQFDVLGNRNPVLGNFWRAPTFIEDGIPPPWSKRTSDGASQFADAGQ